MAIRNWKVWEAVATVYLRVKDRWYRECNPAVSAALARKFKSCGPGFHIYSPFKVSGTGAIEIGSNVHINSYSVIQGAGGLCLGDNIHIGPRLTLYTTSHNYNGEAIPYDNSLIRKPVVIEDNVWIGAFVTIVPGVTIGEGAIVGAGTVIFKDVEPLAIVGSGAQHRVLKYRDKLHYDRLVSESKFGGVGGKLFEANRESKKESNNA